MALFQVLIILAFGAFALSFLFARLAWPKFKNLERRGVLKKAVPDFAGEGNTNSWRSASLMWATRIPADRPGLRKLVAAYRLAQLAALGLMIAAVFAMSRTPRSSEGPSRSNAPPHMVVSVDPTPTEPQ